MRMPPRPKPSATSPRAWPRRRVPWGAFFQEGVGAVREMSAAKRAHAEARGQLEALERSIADAEEELAHRREVAANYPRHHRRPDGEAEDGPKPPPRPRRAQQQATAKQVDALKDQLKRMKDDDAQTEKRLKAAVDSAEAQEASAREQGARLQRRLDDAKRNLENTQTERTQGVSAAQSAVDTASARLASLRDEFRRDPAQPLGQPRRLQRPLAGARGRDLERRRRAAPAHRPTCPASPPSWTPPSRRPRRPSRRTRSPSTPPRRRSARRPSPPTTPATPTRPLRRRRRSASAR